MYYKMAQRQSNTSRSDPGVIVTYGPVLAGVSGVLLGVYASYKASQLQRQVDELTKHLQVLQARLDKMDSEYRANFMNHKQAIDGIGGVVSAHDKSLKKINKRINGGQAPVSQQRSTSSMDLLGDIHEPVVASPAKVPPPKSSPSLQAVADPTSDIDVVISRLGGK